jgi:hypothetical protein
MSTNPNIPNYENQIKQPQKGNVHHRFFTTSTTE